MESVPTPSGEEFAPPSFFEEDYDADEVAELNALAAHGPKQPLP